LCFQVFKDIQQFQSKIIIIFMTPNNLLPSFILRICFFVCSICVKGSFWCFNFEKLWFYVVPKALLVKVCPLQNYNILFVFLLIDKNLASTYNFQVIYPPSVFK
jgi:hypothetical protein